jgi:hypothetical protein
MANAVKEWSAERTDSSKRRKQALIAYGHVAQTAKLGRINLPAKYFYH